MRVILVPLGSHGDVHPFLGLGKALSARGHDVLVVANPWFAEMIAAQGLVHEPFGTIADYEAATSDPDLWHPRRAARVVGRFAGPMIEPLYRVLASRHTPDTVVVAPGLAFGARLAQERLGVRLVTVHLQPVVFWSDHVTPAMAGLCLPARSPRFVKHGLRWLMDRELNIAFGRPLGAARRDLGLRPLDVPLLTWWNSPHRVLALFPEVFGPPQPDWPAQVRLTNFPLFDESDTFEPTDSMSGWLSDGGPPLVFTPGSANRHAHRFFATAVATCRRLGCRGVLLTRFGDQVPSALPRDVRHFDYLPLSFVLPYAAGLVHHGGIGTLSQAAVAGIPQLIVPQAHDQFDNAARVTRLGVGTCLTPGRFRSRRAATALRTLTGSDEVASACRRVAGAVRATPGLQAACQIVEEVER